MSWSFESALQITLFLVHLNLLGALAADHRYNVGDKAPLFVNIVGPLNNPSFPIWVFGFSGKSRFVVCQVLILSLAMMSATVSSETYEYYNFPFCHPDPIVRERESLGEVLNGDRLTGALYNLKFREDKTNDSICEKKLTTDEIALFREAVMKDYYFQFYCDDLAFWGFIGKFEEDSWTSDQTLFKYYLFKHIHIDVLYNGNQVIEVHALSDPNDVIDITDDKEVDVNFTYSVLWNVTSTSFEARLGKYSRASSLPIHQKIHWFSFFNSVAIVTLLMGLLSILFMRHLKNDIRKFSSGDEDEDKEVGWKYLHGDVFRPPQNMLLFSATIGVGTQLLTLVFCLLVLSFVGIIYPYSRGALHTSIVILYSLSSMVSGYSAASFHCQFAEIGWAKSVALAGILFTGPSLATVFILNMVAAYYSATTALPVGTILVVILLHATIGVPLLALGGVAGFCLRSVFQAPCATMRCPRDIPQQTWHHKTSTQMFLSGFLSSSTIILELHHVYLSLWGYKTCTLPGILFVTFIILIVVIALLSVGLTYIQLSLEDHDWWWRSVLCGGSTGVFMFAYSIYFYARSNMSGLLQFSFFFGFTACMCYAFFLMLAMISFRVSFMFVRRIYSAVKSE